MSKTSMTKKQQVITDLYRLCRRRGDLRFHNDEVRGICAKIGFSNPYDATKWDCDNAALLPPALVEDDMFVVPLGRGWHQFVKGIDVGYHRFEEISERDKLGWPVIGSAIQGVATREGSISHVSYNQRIISDFVYKYLGATPKVYPAHQNLLHLEYFIYNKLVSAQLLPVEVGFSVEQHGHIAVFAAKKGFLEDFNVFHLFNPIRYYMGLKQTLGLAIKEVQGCYILREGDRFRLYLYTFDDLMRPASIRLLRNAEYTLGLKQSHVLSASQPKHLLLR